MKGTFSIAIHGGAGTIRQSEMTKERKAELQRCLETAIVSGRNILENGGSAIDATCAAVVEMEDSPLFNAGKGSVFNSSGFIEMDASVMCGRTLAAGAVTCVRNIKNPVLAAKVLLERSTHVLLSGVDAEAFSRDHSLEFEKDNYFYTDHRFQQLKNAQKKDRVQLDHSEDDDGKFGTVGAVALDKAGNLAASTSTGGMTNQLPGRVGDTPLIGSGNYANNQTCAVSCTGIGEGFIRAVSAYDVSALMEYKGLNLEQAGKIVVYDKLQKVGGMGGLIAVDKSGAISLPFNSEGMYRAWLKAGSEIHTAMYQE